MIQVHIIYYYLLLIDTDIIFLYRYINLNAYMIIRLLYEYIHFKLFYTSTSLIVYLLLYNGY